MKHVHFVGIFGSGCSGVSVIAKKLGFDVSGCDPQTKSPYSAQVIEAGIKISPNFNNKDHILDADIVAASPSFLEQKTPLEELIAAKNVGKLMKYIFSQEGASLQYVALMEKLQQLLWLHIF